MSPKSGPDDTLRTEVVDDGATQMDPRLDNNVMLAHARQHLAPEMQKEGERLRRMGCSVESLPALVDIYFSLRSDHYLTSEAASRGVDIYLRARSGNDDHGQALLKLNRCLELMNRGQSYEVACRVVFPSSEGDESSTVLVADQNFGVVLPSSVPQTAIVAANFGQPSAVASPDETLRVADARRRITLALEDGVAIPGSAVVQPASPVAVSSSVVDSGSSSAGGFRSSRTLQKNAIEMQVHGCEALLLKEGLADDIALHARELYRRLLETESPDIAMKKVRLFCEQRQLGASVEVAARAATGKGPVLSGRLDSQVELQLREGRKFTRTEIAALFALGLVVTAGAAIGLYEISSYLHRGEGRGPAEGSGEVQPR